MATHKIKITAFIACALLSVSLFAQDILKDKKGNEIKIVIVSSEGPKLEYKSFFLQDGASLFIDKKDIAYIDHADGKREYFETAPAPAPTTVNAGISTPSVSNKSDAELIKAVSLIYSQLLANEKTATAQNKAIIDLLTSINTNISSLKNEKGRGATVQTPASVAPASDNNNSSAYIPAQAKPEANTSDIPNPDFAEIPYQLKSGQLAFLERTEGNIDFKQKGLYGGSETYISAFGVSSPVRFNSSSPPKIYIKFESQGDPSEKIWLIKGVVTKDRRRFLCSSMSMTGAARNVSNSRIDIQFKPVGVGIFEIILPPLQYGEYAFSAPVNGMSLLSALGGGNKNSSSKISCFGVN